MPGDDYVELSLTQAVQYLRHSGVGHHHHPGRVSRSDNVITSPFFLTRDLRRVRPSPWMCPVPHWDHRDSVQLQLSVKLSSFQPGLQVSFDKHSTMSIFSDDDNVQGVCQEGEELLHGDLDLDQVLCVRLPPAPPALGAQWGHRLLL